MRCMIVKCNTVEYSMTFLYSDWLCFLKRVSFREIPLYFKTEIYASTIFHITHQGEIPSTDKRGAYSPSSRKCKQSHHYFFVVVVI